jgi:outer membrane immunogenic protein
MKRIILATAGSVALSFSSQPLIAAGLPPPLAKGPAPVIAPVAAPLFNWSGFYVGVHAGYGWGNTHQFNPTRSSPTYDWDGFVAGGTLGYNWQNGALVFGLETDLSSGIKGSRVDTGVGWSCGPVVGTFCHNEVKWFGTVRGRLGFAMDRFLPFVTAGWAYGRVYTDYNSCAIVCIANTRNGWTAGAGFEWAFAPNWSVKVEYLHVDLGTHYVPAEDLGLSARFNVIRVGANLRFATGKAPAPVVTKY